MNDYIDWLKKNKITEVECMIPDNSGIPRGKILPTKKFLDTIESGGLRLPLNLFKLSVSRDITYSIDDQLLNPTDGDFVLKPDFDTLRVVPWYSEPTAQIICDAVDRNNKDIEVYSRGILKRVIQMFEDMNLTPVIAPEIEFYLVKKNNDPDYPLETPAGQSGRTEKGDQSYGIDAVNEFDHIFEDLYDFCEAQELDVETINHEDGPAQMEINFKHGNALDLADQVFLFKRTLRQTALKHNLYATFMAKPMEDSPGNSMHIHQSLLKNGKPVFADKNLKTSKLFDNYLGGLQKYSKAFLPLFAPNVNSFKRLRGFWEEGTPFNLNWGYENRTCGFRVPNFNSANQVRIENRLCGSDVNPYLAIAATLSAGYLGIKKKLKASPETKKAAYNVNMSLTDSIYQSIDFFSRSKEAKEIFGDTFVDLFCSIKDLEVNAYNKIITAWEREYLLLNV
ncbi:MAG: glutamine synthetase family protein [Pelagibacteraceae bacterium]|jgi:glutamine synthetase